MMTAPQESEPRPPLVNGSTSSAEPSRLSAVWIEIRNLNARLTRVEKLVGIASVAGPALVEICKFLLIGG